MNKILYGALGAFFISFPMQAKILVYPRIEDKAVVDDGRYKVYVREAGTENAWRELQVFSVEVDMDTRSRAAMAQFDARRAGGGEGRHAGTDGRQRKNTAALARYII